MADTKADAMGVEQAAFEQLEKDFQQVGVKANAWCHVAALGLLPLAAATLPPLGGSA